MTGPVPPPMSMGRKLGITFQRLASGIAVIIVILMLVNQCGGGTDTSRVRTADAQTSYVNAVRSDPFMGSLIEQAGSSDAQLVKGGYKTCDDIESRGMDTIAQGGGPDDTAALAQAPFLAASEFLCPQHRDEVRSFINDHPGDFQ